MTAPWYYNAICADMDVNTFYPHSSDAAGVQYAKSVCAACPVRTDCLDDALAEEGGRHIDGRYGIRGGMSRTQRRREYEKRTRAARLAAPKPNAAPKVQPARVSRFAPKLDDEKRAEIRSLYAAGTMRQAELARRFKVDKATIRRVLGIKAAA